MQREKRKFMGRERSQKSGVQLRECNTKWLPLIVSQSVNRRRRSELVEEIIYYF